MDISKKNADFLGLNILKQEKLTQAPEFPHQRTPDFEVRGGPPGSRRFQRGSDFCMIAEVNRIRWLVYFISRPGLTKRQRMAGQACFPESSLLSSLSSLLRGSLSWFGRCFLFLSFLQFCTLHLGNHGCSHKRSSSLDGCSLVS